AQDKSGLGTNIQEKMETIGAPYNPENVGMADDKKNAIGLYRLAIGLITSFIGVLFFIQTIVGGIQWMTAGGNEEKVTSAKTRFTNGIIGIAIVLSAYIITYFVLAQLSGATGVGTGF
ncbi:hypothetical protein ACFL23_04815, partial [Patescibacteria group bacterium]